MTDEAWIAALSGGLAGALLTQFFGIVLARWRRPQLRIQFSANEAGCALETPAARKFADGRVEQGQQRILRLRISNRGRMTARRASVLVSEITFHPASGDADVVLDETLDLQLALTGDAQFELPPGVHRFVDIVFAEQFGAEPARLRFAFRVTPIRFAGLRFGPGSYSMKLLAACDDCQAVEYRIDWTWNGSWQGLMPTA